MSAVHENERCESGTTQRFDEYLDHLSGGLRRKDHRAALRDYCMALTQPLGRKTTMAMAATLGPAQASAKHQALHHFVSRAPWSDEALLRRVAQWVVPKMDMTGGGWWIVGHSGFPKHGAHSVGVARQHCAVSGRKENCQIAVSVSLACRYGSLPVAWRLYLPQAWAEDAALRRKASVPADVRFATQAKIALQLIEGLVAAGEQRYPVLADACCGADPAFRQALSDLGLEYVVGITSEALVWPHVVEPSNSANRGYGGQRWQPQRTAADRPFSVKAVALGLPATALQIIAWREGGDVVRVDRFAAVRVRQATSLGCWARHAPSQWLLLKWPLDEPEPTQYWLSTLPQETHLDRLVAAAHHRWRTGEEHRMLKEELGLDHYEGRGWPGFHHHATLCVASYGYLLVERLAGRPTRHGEDDWLKR